MVFSGEMTPQVEEKLVILNELHKNKWRPDIVNLLLEKGTLRFSDIQRELNITQKVLTSHLRWLEEHNIVHREIFPEVPPHVEYSLTSIGEHLKDVHETMRVWAEYYVQNTDNSKTNI